MNEGSIPEENLENSLNKSEQVSVAPDVDHLEQDSMEVNPGLINVEIHTQEEIISGTSRKVDEIREKLGLSGKETDIPSIALNKDRLTSLKERLKLFSGIPEAVKKFFRASLISALLTSGFSGEALGQQAPNNTAGALDQKDKGNIAATISPEAPDVVSNNESLPVSTETIKGYIFSDAHERAFLSKQSSESYFALNTEGNADNMKIPLAEIEKFCNEQKINTVSLAHTHPISAYAGVGYFGKEIEEVQSGKLKASPMPPSIVDFQGAAQANQYLEPKGIVVEQKVFDATGIWEFKIDKENINQFNEYKEVIKKTQEMGPRVVAQLSSKEKEIFSKMNNVHQEKILQVLYENPETRALGEKLEKISENELTKIAEKYPEVLEAMDRINVVSDEIIKFDKYKRNPNFKESLDELINEYKLEAAKLGFEVEYTLYPNKNPQ
jgi:hypothetical protein